jgi:uncharacterized protein (TIRG00374 family)
MGQERDRPRKPVEELDVQPDAVEERRRPADGVDGRRRRSERAEDERLLRDEAEGEVVRRDQGVEAIEALEQAADEFDEEMPQRPVTRRYVLLFALFVVGAICFLYFVLPQIAGLQDTWNRVEEGDPWWLAACFLFEVISFCGYVWLFRTVFIRGGTQIGWRVSYQITMASLAATRLFAAAGAGGVALTAWALRRSGMERRLVACRMVAFLTVLYAVYMLALVFDGLGMRIGLFPGPAPFSLTVVPAIFGATVIIVFLAIALLPGDFERRIGRWSKRQGRFGRLAAKLAAAPASLASGVRTAIRLLHDRELGLLGGVIWWGFDIATLWAAFHAFGTPPPWSVIVMAYFVGMIANTLPIPGGIGGVEGGMIGAFAAFDVNAGLAVVAVLVYRAFSFWMPTVPGGIAYLQLRKTVQRWREAPRLQPAGRGARADSVATIQSEVRH